MLFRSPLTVMYREPKVSALSGLMASGRTRAAMTSVPADVGGVRALYRALKRGEAIGMLPDQVPGQGEGEWATFFGRPAYTMTLAMRMAQTSGAPVMVAFAERLAGGKGFIIHVEPLPASLPISRPALVASLMRVCPRSSISRRATQRVAFRQAPDSEPSALMNWTKASVSASPGRMMTMVSQPKIGRAHV